MRRQSIATLVALIALPSIVLAQSAPQPAAPVAAAPAASQKGGFADNPEAKARFEKFRAACGADLQTHCAMVQRGSDQARSEMRQCIETHKAKFSATCQTALTERDAARDARKQTQGVTSPAITEKPKT
jgi:hypothetical protein